MLMQDYEDYKDYEDYEDYEDYKDYKDYGCTCSVEELPLIYFMLMRESPPLSMCSHNPCNPCNPHNPHNPRNPCNPHNTCLQNYLPYERKQNEKVSVYTFFIHNI